MSGLAFFRFLLPSGNNGPEQLDRPLSNFDVIGIPTDEWSSSFFACHENWMPSCLISFFCPCIMWAQIVVRAQIPLLIALKNTMPCFRNQSGYGVFVDYFVWSLILSIGLIITLALAQFPSPTLYYLVIIVVVVALGSLIYLLGHTRTAFKEKYRLPSLVPSLGPDMLCDIPTMVFCMPCALAQMARHVFQYDRMDTSVGFFLSDPSALPPLRPLNSEMRTEFERPERADVAGLTWTNDRRHPQMVDNRGAAHRQEEIAERQRAQLLNEGSAPPADRV